MYYLPEERLNIGRRVFSQEISKEKVASDNISITTVVNYVKEYMKANKIPIVPKVDTSEVVETPDYFSMSKEETNFKSRPTMDVDFFTCGYRLNKKMLTIL